MPPRPDELIRQVTTELKEEKLRELISTADITYHPVPNANFDFRTMPVWRVKFDLSMDSNISIGLDINGELTLGRNQEIPGFEGIFREYDADQLGISRRHVMFRPTQTQLYVIDLGSTNGTWLNGRSIGVNMPYSLADGDLLTVGRLEFNVRIVRRPSGYTAALNTKTDLADTLPSIARAIASQLDQREVLKQAMDMVMSLIPADEVTVWLVDEQTGELFLEAGRGVNDEQIKRLSVADTLAGKVIESGKPLHANRQANGAQIKVKTGYLVEAVIYVPLKIGGVTVGVLSAAHREPGKTYDPRDEKLMTTIADVTAIAIQNARIHEATDRALTRRVKVLTGLNYALSYDLKNLVNAMVGHAGLLNSYQVEGEPAAIIEQLVEAGNQASYLLDQMLELITLNQDLVISLTPVNLVDVVKRAVRDMIRPAEAKHIEMRFEQTGTSYRIQGEAPHLYRSVLNLLDNAIKFSPEGAPVQIALIFQENCVQIKVRDVGPGIPEEDLPHLFTRGFRNRQPDSEQPGLGLGLELVRATAEAHRGNVTAHNADGGGAEFVVTFSSALRVS